jgi:hypothetical protein
MRTIHRHGVLPIFAHLLSLILANFSAVLVQDETAEAASESIAFSVLNHLCLLILRNVKSINLDIAAVEQLLGLSLLQQIAPSSCTHLLDRVFYITLDSLLGLSDGDTFVQFGHQNFEPYLTYECPDGPSEKR